MSIPLKGETLPLFEKSPFILILIGNNDIKMYFCEKLEFNLLFILFILLKKIFFFSLIALFCLSTFLTVAQENIEWEAVKVRGSAYGMVMPLSA